MLKMNNLLNLTFDLSKLLSGTVYSKKFQNMVTKSFKTLITCFLKYFNFIELTKRFINPAAAAYNSIVLKTPSVRNSLDGRM